MARSIRLKELTRTRQWAEGFPAPSDGGDELRRPELLLLLLLLLLLSPALYPGRWWLQRLARKFLLLVALQRTG